MDVRYLIYSNHPKLGTRNMLAEGVWVTNWCIHTIESQGAKRQNQLSVVSNWMDLKSITLSLLNQLEEVTLCRIPSL